jgi:hypothetical protein
VSEKPRFTTTNATEPMFRSATMPSQPLVFPHGPTDQESIEVSEDRVQSGLVEPPVVLNPAHSDRKIDLAPIGLTWNAIRNS